MYLWFIVGVAIMQVNVEFFVIENTFIQDAFLYFIYEVNYGF